MSDSNKMEIFFTIDNGYAGVLATCIASILKSADTSDRLSFNVISHDLSKENKRKLEKLSEIKNFDLKFLSIKKDMLERFPKTTSKQISIATNARLFTAELAPDIEKALFLDCDLVALTSLADLWNLSIDGFYMAAVADPANSSGTPEWFSGIDELPHNFTYVNVGVTYFDLKKWREDNVIEQFVRGVEKYAAKLRYGDQDLLNIALHAATLKIGDEWNYFTTFPDNMKPENYSCIKPRILHWVGFRKPWLQPVRPFSDYFWEFARLTPFYEELMAKYINSGNPQQGTPPLASPPVQSPIGHWLAKCQRLLKK